MVSMIVPKDYQRLPKAGGIEFGGGLDHFSDIGLGGAVRATVFLRVAGPQQANRRGQFCQEKLYHRAMRLILSRKGFDSSAGGFASPILPDGRLVSLPIPAPGPRTFSEVLFDGRPLSELLARMGRRGSFDSRRCHLDPDLRADALPRLPGWRGIFGTVDSAQGHLAKQGVEPGDIFIYFGWFRRCREANGVLRFDRDASDQHVIFGWLQVGEVRSDMPQLLQEKPWTRDHPHVTGSWPTNNTVYVASEELKFGSVETGIPGAGYFPSYDPSLRLTASKAPRSCWELPAWFHPDGRTSVLSYHGNRSRWSRMGDRVHLKTVGRGQEFVLDIDHYPEAIPWLESFFERVPWVGSTSTS